MAPVPFLPVNLERCRSSTTGIRKASVLPLPVFAAPIKSLPDNRGGIDIDWICVIRVKLSLVKAVWVSVERGREEKVSDPE